MQQATALQILQTGANVFLTGEPGSGKTHTINAYVEWLRERGIEPAITASTGIAATHIGGMTIHAWAGIGVKRDLTPYDIDEILARERVVKRVQATRVLIIDEISMIDARTLSMVELVIRAIQRTEQPWGGMQVVFVGDFYQLPPVSKRETREPTIDFDGADETHARPPEPLFAFDSPAWTAANPIVCYLSEQHRQRDAVFLTLLDAIRRGTIGDDHHELLASRAIDLDDIPEGTARLYTHNANVDRENDERLATIAGKTHAYHMLAQGGAHLIEALKRGCLSPETLTLKIGARVMFTKNSMDGLYANGTLGEVVDFGASGPVVRIKTGRTLEVEPAEWSITDSGKVVARITQVPLRLAWAITVHKSQGMTLDAAAVDLSAAFEYGQGYVALSRVRSLQTLHLVGYNDRALLVHPDIVEQDRAFKWNSAAARKKFEAMDRAEHDSYVTSFVTGIGGNPKGGARRTPKEKVDTYETTRVLAARGDTIAAIAKERGLKAETIIAHLEVLKERGTLSMREIESLVPKAERTRLAPVQRTIQKQKTRQLTPLFKALKGKYSFEEIRLARLLS